MAAERSEADPSIRIPGLFELDTKVFKVMASVLEGRPLLTKFSQLRCSRIRRRASCFPAPSFESSNLASPSRSKSVFASTGAIRTIAQAMGAEHYKFGPYKIHPSEVFHSTDLSYAMVNLRPLLPGHVLVCPKREVKRFTDLKEEEISDLWITARNVGALIERYHKATSLTFAIQDGAQAGQTVPHVHIHVLPRKGGDFEKNDEIYDAIDEKEREMKEKLDLDKERKDRSPDEMALEANEYRALFSS